MTKRKHITKHLTKSKKHRSKKFKEVQSDCTILEVINLGIPHVGEQIFSSLDTDELIQCLEVSQPWKALAENVLLKRWKGRIIEACKEGKTVIVKILLANLPGRKTELNTRDVTSRGSNSNSTRSSNLYYCSIKARSSKFIFEPKLELARTRNKSSRVQPKYRCQSRTN